MAIQVNGTEVISNSRALNNIASVDATSAAAMSAAGVGSAPTSSAGGMMRCPIYPKGYNWTSYSADGNGYDFFGVAQSSDVIVICGNQGGTGVNLTSTDNGVSFTKNTFGSTNVKDVDTDGNGNWVQLHYSGACRRSTDNAATWTTGGTASDGEGNYVVYVGNNSWLSFSDGGNTAKRSTNVGSTWSNVSTGMGSVNIRAVAHDGAGTVIAIGIYGTNQMSRSTDYGATWSAFTLSGCGTPHSIGTDGHGNWIIVPEGTTSEYVYISTNNGSSWTSKGTFSHSSWSYRQPGFQGTMGYSDRSGFLTADGDRNKWSALASENILIGLLGFQDMQDKNGALNGRCKYVKKGVGTETFFYAYSGGRGIEMVKA